MAKRERQPERAQHDDDVLETEVHTPDPLPTIYSNSAQVGIAPFDIRVVFRQIHVSTQEKLITTDQVQIFMAPEHAAALADLLITQIRKFEEVHGPLRNPRSSLAQHRTAAEKSSED